MPRLEGLQYCSQVEDHGVLSSADAGAQGREEPFWTQQHGRMFRETLRGSLLYRTVPRRICEVGSMKKKKPSKRHLEQWFARSPSSRLAG